MLDSYLYLVQQPSCCNFSRKNKLLTKNIPTLPVPFFRSLIFVSCCLVLSSASSQTTANLRVDGATLKPVTLREYLSQVQQSNAFLNTKKLAIESSVAMEESMGAANINPSFTLSRGSYYASKPSDTYTPQSNTYSFSGTIEAPGKQQARKDYAAVEVSRTKLDAQVSVKSIEGDATFAFVDSLRLKLIWQALQSANEKIQAINDKEAAAAIENHTAIQKTIANDFKYFSMGMNAFVGQGVQGAAGRQPGRACQQGQGQRVQTGRHPPGFPVHRARCVREVEGLHTQHHREIQRGLAHMKGMHCQAAPIGRALPDHVLARRQGAGQARGGFPLVFVGGFHMMGS